MEPGWARLRLCFVHIGANCQEANHSLNIFYFLNLPKHFHSELPEKQSVKLTAALVFLCHCWAGCDFSLLLVSFTVLSSCKPGWHVLCWIPHRQLRVILPDLHLFCDVPAQVINAVDFICRDKKKTKKLNSYLSLYYCPPSQLLFLCPLCY